MRYIAMFLLSFSISFGLELSEKDFGERIKVRSSKTKEYTLTNDSELTKEYHLSVTDKNVTVSTKKFVLKPFRSRKFKLTAKPKEKGKKEYYLEIKELIKKKAKENSVNVNKLFRIKQNYVGE